MISSQSFRRDLPIQMYALILLPNPHRHPYVLTCTDAYGRQDLIPIPLRNPRRTGQLVSYMYLRDALMDLLIDRYPTVGLGEMRVTLINHRPVTGMDQSFHTIVAVCDYRRTDTIGFTGLRSLPADPLQNRYSITPYEFVQLGWRWRWWGMCLPYMLNPPPATPAPRPGMLVRGAEWVVHDRPPVRSEVVAYYSGAVASSRNPAWLVGVVESVNATSSTANIRVPNAHMMSQGSHILQLTAHHHLPTGTPSNLLRIPGAYPHQVP